MKIVFNRRLKVDDTRYLPFVVYELSDEVALAFINDGFGRVVAPADTAEPAIVKSAEVGGLTDGTNDLGGPGKDSSPVNRLDSELPSALLPSLSPESPSNHDQINEVNERPEPLETPAANETAKPAGRAKAK
jgi:hypothetical protein